MEEDWELTSKQMFWSNSRVNAEPIFLDSATASPTEELTWISWEMSSSFSSSCPMHPSSVAFSSCTRRSSSTPSDAAEVATGDAGEDEEDEMVVVVG